MVIYDTNSVGMCRGGWPLHRPTRWPRLPLHKWRGVVHYWRRQTPLTLFTFSFLTLIPNSFWSFTPPKHTHTHIHKCAHTHTNTRMQIHIYTHKYNTHMCTEKNTLIHNTHQKYCVILNFILKYFVWNKFWSGITVWKYFQFINYDEKISDTCTGAQWHSACLLKEIECEQLHGTIDTYYTFTLANVHCCRLELAYPPHTSVHTTCSRSRSKYPYWENASMEKFFGIGTIFD